ncbi:hypothetical protein B0T10DRAFT_187701 [Thelonectria olida]|uniref:Uncharacterized protein n=1 Tax=Thelonectria olida TaxID=1576542 RepID=A0A9P8WFR4_9HYPO|nr:hypothetical protein B0T10DRAFT_187701 [Thelonectria olida]
MGQSYHYFVPSEEHRPSQAYRSRISTSSIAQLVSKFESLDTEQCPHRHRHSDTGFINGSSCVNLGRQLCEHYGTNTISTDQLTFENFCNAQGNDSTSLSRACLSSVELTAQPCFKLHRSQSLKTKPSGSFGLVAFGERHRSVAERRRIFETGPAIPSSHPLKLLSPSKSVNVSSLPTAHPKLTIPRVPINRKPKSTDLSPTSPLGLYIPQPRGETKHVHTASTDVSRLHFETPPEYAAYELEATSKDNEHASSIGPYEQISDPGREALYTPPGNPQDAYRGPHTDPLAAKRQSMTEKGPGYRSNRSKSPSSVGFKHPTWLENAERMASSLSASTSRGELVTDLQIRRHPKVYRPKSKHYQPPASIKVNAMTGPIVSGPGSKVSALRQRFDLSKNSTTLTMSFIPRRRGRATPTKGSRFAPLSLHQKSETTTNLGHVDSQEQTSRDDGAQAGNVALATPTSTGTRRTTNKGTSPLKDKIGLFESLGHRDGDDDFEATSHLTRRVLGKGRSHGVKSAIRRFSASFRKSSSEWSTTSPPEFLVPSQQTLTEKHPGHTDKAFRSSFNHEAPRRETEETLRRDIRTKNKGEKVKIPSPRRQSYHGNGEGGIRFPLAGMVKPKLSSHANIGHRRRSSTGSNRHSWLHESGINDTTQAASRNIGRRIMSRSSGPFISKARCALEQPVPVRANELKRLISMCKSRVARQSSSGDKVWRDG